MKSLRIVPIALVVVLVAVTNWAAPPAFGASYVVDTTSDASLTACTGAAADCSIRGAITNANTVSTPGDVITFDATVFTGGPNTPTPITIASSLPTLTGGGDTIDGTGVSVLVDSSNDPPTFDCLTILSSSNTISRLQFTDCYAAIAVGGGNTNTIGPANVIFDSNFGVSISIISATGNVIKGNKIGTTADGTLAHVDGGIAGSGIDVAGNNTIVGGASASDRNILSNNANGIRILGGTGNVVKGNYIGTDGTGTVDLGNSTAGVMVLSGGNTIGGLLPGEGNLISGNGTNLLLQAGSFNTNVVNNIIGPDINGSGATMTTSDAGVVIFNGSDDNEITGNLISDNLYGIVILSSTTNGNVVKGNFIGTGPGGSGAVPNSNHGILVDGGAHDNTIGGTLAGEGNVIANNGSPGVLVQGSGTTGNSVRGNSIHDNAGSEILLLSGGNTELPAPSITAAGLGAAGGTTCANCTVDVFSDGVADAEFFEGSTVADGSGNFVLAAAIAGPMVTATATDTSGNTSQLSTATGFVGADGDSDGVPTSLDNCSLIANGPAQSILFGIGYQTDSDGDGIPGFAVPSNSTIGGDACDVDDDNDGQLDSDDGCRTLPEDFDGYQDADGCPDTDDDGDNVPDTSDAGKLCFDPAGTLTCATISCRLAAEDYDAFKDGDGCPEPDNDNDGFTDATDDCPGTDSRAGADGMLGSPQDLNHNGVQNGAEAALTTDDVMPALVWEDSDGVLDTDGCHDSPGDDFDGDGFTDNDEVFTHLTDAGNPDTDADAVVDGTDNCPNWPNAAQTLPAWTIPALDSDCDGWNKTREQWTGTDPTKHCNATPAVNDEAIDFWPTDFNDSQLTGLADVVLMGPVYNQSTGNDQAKRRFDLNASGIVSLADVVLMGPFYNKSCA